MTVTNADLLRELRLHRAMQELTLAAVETILLQGERMAKKADEFAADFEQRYKDLSADVAAGKILNDQTIAFIQGQVAQNAALRQQNDDQKKQIDDLMAQSGLDPAVSAKLQAVLDGIDGQNALLDKQREDVSAVLKASTPTA